MIEYLAFQQDSTDGQARSTGERIAAECRGMTAGREGLRNGVRRETGSDGHAATQPFAKVMMSGCTPNCS